MMLGVLLQLLLNLLQLMIDTLEGDDKLIWNMRPQDWWCFASRQLGCNCPTLEPDLPYAATLFDSARAPET